MDGHILVEKFFDWEGVEDDQTEDHQDLGWNYAAVTFNTFIINFNHMMKYFDPMDSNTDRDYTSEIRDTLMSTGTMSSTTTRTSTCMIQTN